MRKGIVQYYLPDKGYGYIRDTENREEFHFTKKNLLEAIQSKDVVYFEVRENKYGLIATNIRKAADLS